MACHDTVRLARLKDYCRQVAHTWINDFIAPQSFIITQPKANRNEGFANWLGLVKKSKGRIPKAEVILVAGF
jgi:hypothetical protein